MARTSGILDIGGVALEYSRHGPHPGAAPTLVMLHEGLGCVALWRDFPARLAAATGRAVVAYSRAGYGGSDPTPLPRPMDYMTREAVDVLPLVLDTLGFRRGLLLGHSDGATIAAIHAGQVQDKRVRGLILMAPHFFAEDTGLAEIARAREAFETTDLRERMARYHREPDIAFRGWNDAWLDPAFRHWNVEPVLDRLTVPVLAIQGAADQYGTLAQIETIRTRSPAPVRTEILADCRHTPHLEHPDRTIEVISQFVTQTLE